MPGPATLDYPFPVLVDVEARVNAAYGALRPDGGVQPTVVLVGLNGRVRHRQASVAPQNDLLAILRGGAGGTA